MWRQGEREIIYTSVQRHHQNDFYIEEKGEGLWRQGEREIIYTSVQRHHHNDFYTEMGRDESHFNVS